jgi:ribose transport system permease protein
MSNRQAEARLHRQSGRALSRVLLNPEVGVLIPIIILSVITTSIKPAFFTWRYFASILTGSIFIGAAAMGEGFTIMSGEIDLSVGMNGTLSGVMAAYACINWGFGIIPTILAGLATGALVGAINGFCVTKLRLSSWITTLATQFICSGLAVTISNGYPMPITSLGTTGFTRARPLGLSWLFFIFIGLIIISDLVIRKTKFGYEIRAVGGNREAAQMAGINVNRVKMLVFIVSGLFAAIGGLFDVFANATASSSFGAGREFRAIICVAIGGISMSGGSGSMYGAGLGVLLFHTLWYALRILKVDTNLQLVLIGAILLMSVSLDIFRKRVEARRMISA